jgi:hypothetical protein
LKTFERVALICNYDTLGLLDEKDLLPAKE